MTRQDDFDERRTGRERMFRVIGLIIMWLITCIVMRYRNQRLRQEIERTNSFEDGKSDLIEELGEVSEENESELEPEQEVPMMEFDWEGEYDFELNDLMEPMEMAMIDPDIDIIEFVMNELLLNREESTDDGSSDSSDFSD